MGVDYWSLRTGIYDSISYHSYSDLHFRQEISKPGNIIIVDLYTYAGPSMTKENELLLTSKLLDLVHEKNVSLFIMSPTYSNSAIQKIRNQANIIALHNYSIPFFKTVHSWIHHNENLFNSQLAS